MLASSLVATLILFVSALAQSQELLNGRFEDGALDAAPESWRVPTPDFEALTVAGAREGERCVQLRRNASQATSPFGNLMQTIDATPWRGKPIRLSASVRLKGDRARAQMWLRVDREPGKIGLFDNMDDRPARSTAWQECEITGVVDPDARLINVGFMLFDGGELWIDSVKLEATGAALEFAQAEPPRALTDAGLANLVAFAQLFGYVRHFHPSDESAGANWDEVAVQGVRAVESAASARDLAVALNAHFAPLAPSVRVFAAGTEPASVPEFERAPEGGWILYWKHRGFGQKNPSAYASERVRASSADELPDEVPDPAHPYAAKLAGGVECLVPLAVYSTSAGTLPRARVHAANGALHRPSGDDRATHLADVVLAWNVFQHFYPYFDVTPVDWDRELERALRSAATDDGERSFLDTLRRMVAALADGHGYVHQPSDVRIGFLPLEWAWIEDRLVVTAVASGLAQPAPGDVVLSIDGLSTAERLASAEALISGATPQWVRGRALDDLRLRSTLAPCVLELATYPDDAPARCELSPGRTRFGAPDFLPPKTSELVQGVWYVDLGRATEGDLKAIVEDLADASAVIFDLRGYPRGLSPETIFGHLIEKPVTSAQWHVPTVLRPNREQLGFERGGEWDLRPLEPFFQCRKAFLTGGGAISYAESCMGIVEHYRLAEIVGEATAGTNGNVNPFELPGGYGVSWTGMKVLKHDGSRHHGVGIQPTVPVTRTRKGAAEGRDEVLERAVDLVRE